jgi:CRP-like cAMP-binding protein
VTNYGVEIESGPIDSSLMVDEMEVNELDENATEWMMGLLRCETFHKVPPANIQRLAVAMEPIEVKQGDVIIRQNDPGDYYYVIRQGHCKITRSDNLLAKLGPLQAFGEEALASGARRNATVTMTSDGLLMRLSKEDFDEILRPPLIHSVELSEIKPLLHKGAILLDVRTRAEYKQQRLIRSLNLPLDILRKKIHKLNHDKHYIIYCDTGARSSAATFLLTQMGFHAVLLNHPENAFRTITAS